MNLVIIIPAYNAKETINNTLDSIKQQQLSITYEVVLVNDCSDYNYDDIVSAYSKFFLIRELKTEKNVGPGGARQYGIDHSFSDYIVFIDSDDVFYGSDSLEKMYNEIKKNNYDILIGNFLYMRDNKIKVKRKDFVWLHGKMYKREFLNIHNIRFNNSRKNEDNGFNRLFLLLEPKLTFYDEIVYVYKENPNSITRKNNCSYKFYGIEGFCFNMNWAMEEALIRGVSKELIAVLSYDVLCTLYVYYLGLEKEYDVSKILLWGKPIKDKYCLYINLLDYDLCLEGLNMKKEILKDEFLIKDYYITFTEFLDMI